MSIHVALLRGINVGGHNTVPMADLRALFVSLGYGDVKTVIQSGNVLFTTARAPTPRQLETAISDRFGVEIVVALRSLKQLQRLVADNPFPHLNDAYLHVGFMTHKPQSSVVGKLDGQRFAPEQFSIVGTHLFLYLPDGMARTKLPGYLDRQLKVPTTIRNWKTANKLIALAEN